METENTLTEQLQAAHDSLTPENWYKNSYFANRNNTLCMCAHGALQAQVNPECKKAIAVNDDPVAAEAAFRRFDVVRAAQMKIGMLTASSRGGKAATSVWNNRPDRIKKDYGNLGNLNAHYLLGMVGLTAEFNDSPETTLEMVKAKFREAVVLANQLQL